MPPKINPSDSRSRGRGGQRGQGGRGAGDGRGAWGGRGAWSGQPAWGSRGGGSGSGSGSGGPVEPRPNPGPPSYLARPPPGPKTPLVAPHVTTVGVKRKEYGTQGFKCKIITNHFPVTIPKDVITHYDVIHPSEKTLPVRMNMELVARLQKVVAPNIFTPRAVYDGRKNLFTIHTLKFPNEQDHFEFEVSLTDPHMGERSTNARSPKVYKIKLTKVAEINPIVLHRYLEGKQSLDNNILTAITALNVVIRMDPTQQYPSNSRSFFTPNEKKWIGQGIELWRGYFQSIRPARNRMLINIDISTGAMFKAGPLVDLCYELAGLDKSRGSRRDYAQLSCKGRSGERIWHRLQRSLVGLRIRTTHTTSAGYVSNNPKSIKKFTERGAEDEDFLVEGGKRLTIAKYFRQITGTSLRYPDLPCVVFASGAKIPVEYCVVVEGQLMRKQVPSELVKDVLNFATKKPEERLRSICDGLNILNYDESEYLKQFKMFTDQKPLEVQARILPPPKLQFGQKTTAIPEHGYWNMSGRKFHKAVSIESWMVVIFERRNIFNDTNVINLVKTLVKNFDKVGITCKSPNAHYEYLSPQGDILMQIKGAARNSKLKQDVLPKLVIAVLPDGSADLYSSIKYFGDCNAGVTTQCMRATKCIGAKDQYYSNICLKINTKLGGINSIPEPISCRFLTDPSRHMLVLGADVIHPAPGSGNRPSFTALVGNIDSDLSKYVATTRVQESRREMIDDLDSMVKFVIEKYGRYDQDSKTSKYPKQILFYRDGVSEGQFGQVLEHEVPLIKKACIDMKLDPMPKITVVIVGKRHHVRFFPTSTSRKDKSGNCPAGTIVDQEITNPSEFDFYLQSHGGILGTSRPAHYNVLLDENDYSPDSLQRISFALCHVYARSTRSVSIPAPVYYADIVCARAKNHFSPKDQGIIGFDDSSSQGEDTQTKSLLELYKSKFTKTHQNMESEMYFT